MAALHPRVCEQTNAHNQHLADQGECPRCGDAAVQADDMLMVFSIANLFDRVDV